jgi:hypothetical protein
MYVGDGTAEHVPPGTINRQLDPDDIAAAQYVYGVRGDYNRNGAVDAGDYVIWRKTNGQTVTPGTGAAGNIDGVVNALDRDAWRAAYGNVQLTGFGEQPSFGAGAGAGIPEPGAVWLLANGIVGGIWQLGRRGRPE